MTLEINEAEMIERFCDSLKKSSARAREFSTTELNKKPALFVDFIDGLKIAAGSSHQLAHAQENPHFLTLRDILEGVIEVSQSLPVFSGNQDKLWESIAVSLEQMAKKGQTMATSLSMKRVDVLANLNLREMKNRPETRH